MRSNKPIREIYAKSAGINLPPRVRRLLLGAEVVWFDRDPLSQEADPLHFYFDSHTSSSTDMLLRRHGMTDVSQYVNIKFKWGV